MEKELDFIKLLDETEKGLTNDIIKLSGKIEMIQEFKNYFVTKNLKVVETEPEQKVEVK